MTQQRFNDRFTYSSGLTEEYISTLTDSELLTIPKFKDYVDQVRQYSVLIKGTNITNRMIYDIAIKESDTRISLLLSAAKDLNNQPLFPNINIVKSLMFGPTNTTDLYNNDKYNIFVDGLTRVSVALTAYKLINQLAQIPEQFKHAEAIQKQALIDIEAITKLYTSTSLTSDTVDTKVCLYFEVIDFELDINNKLVCEVYIPSISTDNQNLTTFPINTNWEQVFEFTGSQNTSTIVSYLSDYINSYTLNTRHSNILTAPTLNDLATQTHCICFDSRYNDPKVTAELISIRFKILDNNNLELSTSIPFKWGKEVSTMTYTKLLSLLMAVKFGKVASSSEIQEIAEPTVLYIKRSPYNSNKQPLDKFNQLIPISLINPDSQYSFRISNSQDKDTVVRFPYELTNNINVTQLDYDRQRPQQFANSLVESLFNVKRDNRVLGILFRVDSLQTEDPICAIELCCFTASRLETWAVLDIINIPPDICLATGNLSGPLTPFSNNPRTIRVNKTFTTGSIASNVGTLPGESSSASFVSFKRDKKLNSINDRLNRNRFL